MPTLRSYPFPMPAHRWQRWKQKILITMGQLLQVLGETVRGVWLSLFLWPSSQGQSDISIERSLSLYHPGMLQEPWECRESVRSLPEFHSTKCLPREPPQSTYKLESSYGRNRSSLVTFFTHEIPSSLISPWAGNCAQNSSCS